MHPRDGLPSAPFACQARTHAQLRKMNMYTMMDTTCSSYLEDLLKLCYNIVNSYGACACSNLCWIIFLLGSLLSTQSHCTKIRSASCTVGARSTRASNHGNAYG